MELFHIFHCIVLDSEVVHNQCEHDTSCIVFPEAGCVFYRMVPSRS